jgi:hypothetical protein
MFATSLSLNPALTWRVARLLRVMNPELLLELELDVLELPVLAPAPVALVAPVPLVPVPEAPVDPLDPLDPLEVVVPDDDAPPPDTVVPGAPLIADTVPSAGARSVVSFSVFCALVTLD